MAFVMTDEKFFSLPPTIRLWFLSLAFADMNAAEGAARKAIELLDSGGDAFIYEALVEISVVRYMRPFKASYMPENKGRIMLPTSYEPTTAPLRFHHETILHVRDKSAAHSDMEVRQTQIRRNQRAPGSPPMWQSLTSRDVLEDFTLRAIPALALMCKQLIMPKVNGLADELIGSVPVGSTFDLSWSGVHPIIG
jgi:hypothetical protein